MKRTIAILLLVCLSTAGENRFLDTRVTGYLLNQSGDNAGVSTENLLALWHFESLPLVQDYSGRSNQLMTTGGSAGTGKFGSCFTTAAATDGASTLSACTIPNTLGQADGSFVFWLKTSESNAGYIYLSWRSSATKYFQIKTAANAANIRVYAVDGTYTLDYSTTGKTVNDGAWHHVAVVRDYTSDTANNFTTYIDGVSYGTSAVDADLGDCGDTTSLCVGQALYASTSTAAMSIDCVSVWSKALSASEVRSLCSQGQETHDAITLDNNRLAASLSVFNAATLGGELVTNGAMSGTYVSGVAPNWSENDSAALGTPTEEAGAGAYGGSGSSQKYVITSGAGNTLIYTAVGSGFAMQAGKWYRLQFAAKVSSGEIGYVQIRTTALANAQTVVEHVRDAAWTLKTYDFRSTYSGTTQGVVFYNGYYTPATFWVDAVSLKEITDGDLYMAGDGYVGQDMAIEGGDVTTNATTATVFNTNATTLNVGQAATTVSLGATTGTATVRNATLNLTGDLIITGGDIVAGASAITRGTLLTYHGGAGNTPGYWLTYSPNGTASYYSAGDDGRLRRHTSAPAATTDGTPVGGGGLGLVLTTEGSLATEYTEAGTGYVLKYSNAVTISEGISQFIVEADGKKVDTGAADEGNIKIVLATTDTGTAYADNVTMLSGYWSDAGSLRALVGAGEVALTNAYLTERWIFECTRMAAGTYYVNFFVEGETDGADESTGYIKNMYTFTN